MLLMIDNYDSFTYNLVQYLGELGANVVVKRNDEIDINGITNLSPERIMISPGPGTPDDAGISLELIREFAGQLPILGVCLGHQAIGQAFGGSIIHARKIMHGKTSPIYHHDTGVFHSLEQGYEATRYHSLVIDKQTFPEELEITSWTQTDDNDKIVQPNINKIDEIMGIRHKTLCLEGVQFHPESILTQHGHDLLKNFLNMNV